MRKCVEGVSMSEEKLFGFPKYEVESLADTLERARTAENMKPDLYAAAIKLLERRQQALNAILSGIKGKRK